MSVTLTPQAENRIRHWIESGQYATADEAIDAAIQFLDEHERLNRLAAAFSVADAQIARGDGIELTPELWEEIEREADEADRLGLPVNPDVCP